MRAMTPARYIRTQVFHVATQEEFARLLNVEQPTVSRWESGVQPISRQAMDAMRALAVIRRIPWDNNWLFEVPREPPERPRRRGGAALIPA